MANEPVRWLDEPESPELLGLMRAGSEELAPADALARVAARLAEVEHASASKDRSSAAPPRAVWLKVRWLVLLIGAAGLTVYFATRSAAPTRDSARDDRRAKEATAAPTHVPSDEALRTRDDASEKLAPVAPPSEPAPAVEQTAPGATERGRSRGHARVRSTAQDKTSSSPSGPAERDTRLEQARLLEQARQQLAVEPTRALELLRDHVRRFPTSWLEEERGALTIRALAQSGQREQAERELARFRVRHPGSVHTLRLERALNRTDGSPARATPASH